MEKNSHQPKDTGKLTNFHYGSAKDNRVVEVETAKGTTELDSNTENKSTH